MKPTTKTEWRPIQSKLFHILMSKKTETVKNGVAHGARRLFPTEAQDIALHLTDFVGRLHDALVSWRTFADDNPDTPNRLLPTDLARRIDEAITAIPQENEAR